MEAAVLNTHIPHSPTRQLTMDSRPFRVCFSFRPPGSSLNCSAPTEQGVHQLSVGKSKR